MAGGFMKKLVGWLTDVTAKHIVGVVLSSAFVTALLRALLDNYFALPRRWSIVLWLGVFCAAYVGAVIGFRRWLPSRSSGIRVSETDSEPLPLKYVLKDRAPIFELAGPLVKNRAFYLVDVPRESGVIRNKVFEDCDILGPAVIFLIDRVQMFELVFGTGGNSSESIFIEIPRPPVARPVVGVIGIYGCTFRQCRLRDISILGFKETVEQFTAQLKDTPR